jgi:MerR family Zn(II)-responsive transcriptional regulator of zntA
VRGLLEARLSDLDAQIAQLAGLRATIAALLSAVAEMAPETCTADDVCRYL